MASRRRRDSPPGPTGVQSISNRIRYLIVICWSYHRCDYMGMSCRCHRSQTELADNAFHCCEYCYIYNSNSGDYTNAVSSGCLWCRSRRGTQFCGFVLTHRLHWIWSRRKVSTPSKVHPHPLTKNSITACLSMVRTRKRSRLQIQLLNYTRCSFP